MNHFNENQPLLVEPNMINHLNNKLKICHINKNYFYYLVFNIICFVFFILTLAIILLFKYKKKNNNENYIEKMNIKRKYILTKISELEKIKKTKLKTKLKNTLITNLPSWDSDIQLLNKNKLN